MFVTVISQSYDTHTYQVYVILGNAAILKCEIPSFVADFVHVTSWVDETSGESYIPDHSFGSFSLKY